MAIAVSQRPVRLREVLLRDKPGEMLAASGKGTVPVLVDQNTVIDESLGVMKWALEHNDPQNWLASANDPLITHNDGPFKHHLDRYKYASRYEDEDPNKHRDAGYAFLEPLERRLEAAAYLAGQGCSFVDIAIFPFVRQFRIADERWFDATPVGRVQRWLSGLTGSALFESVMGKYPLWKETGEEFVFPNF